MNDGTAPSKGIHALIYRDALCIDFSNRGLAARVTEVTVVGPGIDPIFEPTNERPAVRIVRREHPGGTIYHAEPLPSMVFHDLRRTAVTLAISAGAHVKVVQQIVGHSSATTLDVYAQLFADAAHASARAVDALLNPAKV